MKFKYLFMFIIAIIVVLYFIPAKQSDFFKNYPKKDTISNNLKKFYTKLTKKIEVNGIQWQYYINGNGKKTILFLHGMGGAYDLWWQQLNYFKDKYTVISYTLPTEINNLEDAYKGIQAILQKEKIKTTSIVGTSMGGYIAQYLVKKMPDKIEKAVFGNTFPPNTDLLKDKMLIRNFPQANSICKKRLLS